MLVVAATYFFVARPRFEIRITAGQIQSLIEKKFPYEKRSFLLVKTVISNPQVHLEKGKDRIGVGCDLSVFITGVETLESKVYAETKISYKAESREVFISDVRLKRFEIRGIPAETERIVRTIVGEAMMEILGSHPIYRIDKDDIKSKVAGAVFKGVKIEDGFVKVIFGL